MLLVVEYITTEIALKKSGIMHSDGGREVFAARPLGKRNIVGFYYGTLLCKGFGFTASSFKSYGQTIMKATRQTFSKLGNRLQESAMDRNMVQHLVWMVPVLFCAMCYLNNG